MKKIMLGAGAVFALALSASGAAAIGGGPTPPWASPYAILVPETVAPQAAEEGRAAFENRNAHYCPPGDAACERRLERRERATPARRY